MSAALTNSAKTYNLEEFWALPEPEDRSKLELIGGYLYMSPPPDNSHNKIISRLLDILFEHRREQGLRGWINVPRSAIWTGEQTYLEPDLFYLSAKREASFAKGKYTSADLVVEVLSPGSRLYDRTTKSDAYAALGVDELWLIDEDACTLEVRQQTGQGFGMSRVFTTEEILNSSVFPQLALRIAALFHD
jgi:Uma2 family endonuclease